MSATRRSWWAFGLAVVGALLATFAPLGTSRSVSSAGAGVRTEHLSLFQVDGSWVLVVVAIPVVIAAMPTLWRRRPVRIASAVLLWAWCVIAMWSVGLFFIPSAVLMTLAAATRPMIEPALD